MPHPRPYASLERSRWEVLFETTVSERVSNESVPDPAHDLSHFKRVVKTAKQLCSEENAIWEVVVPASWLHDFVAVPKNDPRRDKASRLSATEALQFLDSVQYPIEYFPSIAHAIEAHSFSAGIECNSLEARIVQDADRLDALGAIGIARLFAVSAQFKSSFYDAKDPHARQRPLDDRRFAVDHFYTKLFKITETLQTRAGREEGARRAAFMKKFLDQFFLEAGGD